ncbi:VanZ family protein [Thalassoroseus pseudoceratinae]|uniref:VanZ family protein n=1 Tax=Thalassoroseus pseudoceratinae TaxID=2713176 RepID=UPI0014241B88|nr:VanZ family protein [Thalassoroseus pseudoceratinae]
MSETKKTPDAIAKSYWRPGWLKWVVLIYWIGVFSLTHVPMPDTPSSIPHADKIAHFAFYTGLSFLLAAWLSVGGTTSVLKVFFVCVSYAAFDELTQIPIPTRSGDWRDWIADAVGAIVGIVAWSFLKKRWFKQSR